MFLPAHHGLPCQQLRCYTDFSCLQIPRVLQSHQICESPGPSLGGTPSGKILSIAPAKYSGDLCWERAKQLPGTGPSLQRGMPRVRLERQSPLEGQELGIRLLRAKKKPLTESYGTSQSQLGVSRMLSRKRGLEGRRRRVKMGFRQQ